MENFKFTSGVFQAIKNSQIVSQKCNLSYVGTEEILYGLLNLPLSVACKCLNKYGVDKKNYYVKLQKTFDVNKRLVGYTPRAKGIINEAERLADSTKVGCIYTEHVLLAILKKKDCQAASIIRNMNVDYEGLLNELEEKVKERAREKALPSVEGDLPTEKTETGGNTEEKSPLDGFGYDLTERAEKGKIDPVIGRDNEIERVIQTLSRRNKNSPVLTGEPGVGKSAVVEGLAMRIVNDNVPDTLRGKTIFSLNLSGLLAGTKYRGEFEERFQKAIDYVVENGNIILFIDEIHNIMGAGSTGDSNFDLGEMLKPMLARGELQTIGATTTDEYRRYIEPDPAMERRFQQIQVDAPDVENTILILKGLRDKYEAHHNVIITDEAIESAVKLSDRYITDRNLPDKAIDLIDETASKAKLKFCYTPKDISEKQERVRFLTNKKNYLMSDGQEEIASSLQAEIDKLKYEIQTIENRKFDEMSSKTPSIGEEEVAEVISEWTKIPLTRITSTEAERLAGLEYELRDRVIGQDLAVSTVSRAIKRARACVKDPSKPIGTFIFVGPTGVGKTELSKALADVVFGSANSLIRIDMSEYMEENSVNKLIGAPPGYVGYEEAGILTEKVKRNPYSVVLFDEIEKACPKIFNIMLQILDEGRLTDNKGKIINFKNTIIILTSNVGAVEKAPKPSIGFASEKNEEDELRERYYSALKRKFSPEFLNRLDDIVIFNSLSREDCGKICEILIDNLKSRLKESRIDLKVTASAIDLLIDGGYDETYGARPLKREIQRKIEDMLSEEIICGRIVGGNTVTVYADGGKMGYILGEPKE